MGVRDRLVTIVLAAGVLLGMATWQAVTPLLGIAVVLASVVGASAVYRLEAHRPPLDERLDDVEVSTPRRAAGRP